MTAWADARSIVSRRIKRPLKTATGPIVRRIDDARGWIAVSLAASGVSINVEMSQSLAPVIGTVIARVKQLFDLGAAPDAVTALLSKDSGLAGVVRHMVMEMVRCSRACSVLPVRWYSLLSPKWQWAMTGLKPRGSANAKALR